MPPAYTMNKSLIYYHLMAAYENLVLVLEKKQRYILN